jgi:hypothetical protein
VPAVVTTELCNLFRVGGDNNILQLLAGTRSFVNMREHGTAGELAKNLSRQTRGGKSCGDDGDGFHGISFKVERQEWQARGSVFALFAITFRLNQTADPSASFAPLGMTILKFVHWSLDANLKVCSTELSLP